MKPLDSWLAEHCAAAPAARCGAVLLRHGAGLQPAAAWPAGSTLPPALARAATAALSGRGAVVTAARSGSDRVGASASETAGATAGAGAPAGHVVAHPLSTAGIAIGVVVVFIASATPPGEALLNVLQRHADGFEQALPPARDGPASDGLADTAGLARDLFALDTFRDAATGLTALLAARLGCQRVAFGLRDGGVTQVQALSDGSGADTRADHIELAAAMDEAMDEADTLVWPSAPDAPPRILAAHLGLARRQGLVAVASVPLVHGGRVRGALTLEIAHGAVPPAPTLQRVAELLQTVGPWLLERHASTRPLSSRALRALARQWRALREPGHLRLKAAALAAAAAAVWLAVVPVPREVTVDARLEGLNQRALAAPSDGYIKNVFVRPGDPVRKGQTLLAFEGEDLRLELQRLNAERAGEEATLGDALQREDRARAALASAKHDEIDARIEQLQHQLERAELKAPFDGIVLAGDLQQQLGTPVQRGTNLLTIAPVGGFRAIVEIPDADVARVRAGQPGTLVLTARPEHAWPLRVLRITPMAVAETGRSVFEAEVTLDARADAALLPGMRGIARLQVDEQARALQWAQATFAWLRLSTWRWFA